MKNSKEVFNEIMSGLTFHESREEKESIVRILMEKIFGIDRLKIMGNAQLLVTPEDQHRIDDALVRLNTGEPVQYVVGEADFYNKIFSVNSHVLIPRPETEELVEEVLVFLQQTKRRHWRIIDIGTGSGCIPVMLAIIHPEAEIFASDISENTMEIAERNKTRHNTKVKLMRHDILTEDLPIDNLDIVISNPPYIAMSEMKGMNDNVVNFEPHLALFVSDNDPLIFYKRISSQARSVLTPRGLLIFEINERFGSEVAEVVRAVGFENVEILKDLSGKNRMVKAIQP